MYARSVRIPGAIVLALSAAAVAPAACHPAQSTQRADLCVDLSHLRATIALLASPPADASVGEVRADLDKLDPTFGAVSDSGTVSQDVVDRLVAEHEAYRAVIDGVGDDDRFSTVRAEATAPAQGLDDAFEAVVTALRCDTATPD